MAGVVGAAQRKRVPPQTPRRPQPASWRPGLPTCRALVAAVRTSRSPARLGAAAPRHDRGAGRPPRLQAPPRCPCRSVGQARPSGLIRSLFAKAYLWSPGIRELLLARELLERLGFALLSAGPTRAGYRRQDPTNGGAGRR